MRAWRLNNSTDTPGLICQEIPDPKPGPGEVLIRVRAAGVTPTELSWYPTTKTRSGEKRLSAVPGHEFAGTVATLGPGSGGFKAGDEVYGMNDWFGEGATAELCITRPEWIVARPRHLSFVQAASVPIGALTAWQGLFDRAKLQAGETVLIHGGSGAVGVFAIQLARNQGANVITTASARHKDFLLKLGAKRVIDYATERFDDLLHDVDVIFDGVGGETLQRSWKVLSPTGRLVTIASDGEGSSDERTKKAFFIVEPNRTQLLKISELLDAGTIDAVVDSEVPFSQAGAAYGQGSQRRSVRGKAVVVM